MFPPLPLFCELTLTIRLIEEDKQRQMAEMKGSLLGYIQGGAGPKPEEKKA
jgi:hypothetical protein